jgi:hypothetical protein
VIGGFGTPLSVLIAGPETALGSAVLRSLQANPSYVAHPLWMREQDFLDQPTLGEAITHFIGRGLKAIINCSAKLDQKASWTDLYLHNVMPACVLSYRARTANALYVQAGRVFADNPVALSLWMADQHIHAPRHTSWPECLMTVRLHDRTSHDVAAKALIGCLKEARTAIYDLDADGQLMTTSSEDQRMTADV